MTNLDEYRKEIDEIDTKIIALYEARMEVVKKVIAYKLENNIPVLDSSRETKMLDNNLTKLKNEEFKKYYKDVLDGFLKASKTMQSDILKNSN